MLVMNYIMKTKIFLIALILSAGISTAQNCRAELKVSRDRNFDSANENGALFEMELKNNGSSSEIFSIESAFLSESCSNESLKTSAPNVKLDIEYPSSASASLKPTNVTVKAGETFRFKMKINVPAGTPIERWSCIEVSAISKNCKTAIASTVLHVFVPDNSEQ